MRLHLSALCMSKRRRATRRGMRCACVCMRTEWIMHMRMRVCACGGDALKTFSSLMRGVLKDAAFTANLRTWLAFVEGLDSEADSSLGFASPALSGLFPGRDSAASECPAAGLSSLRGLPSRFGTWLHGTLPSACAWVDDAGGVCSATTGRLPPL